MLYVLLYPRFSDQAALEIERFRNEFDRHRAKMIRAHITLVFGVTGIGDGALLDRTQRVCTAMKPFDIAFTRVEQVFDKLDQTYKLFLLPSIAEQDAIIAMYRSFYGGPLAAELRKDIPFRPHMTIATCANALSVEVAVREAQCFRLPMSARVTSVAIVKRDGDRIEEIADVPLPG